MTIAISADTSMGIAMQIPELLRKRGHEVLLCGALTPIINGATCPWASMSAGAALLVVQGFAQYGIVCCTTGTGATIAANKVTGARAALCTDAYTASGARKWNDANILGISLRLTTIALMEEMLDAWFAVTEVAPEQLENIAYLSRIS